jgi:hypothetical protein
VTALRSLIAVVAGYGAMAILVMVGTIGWVAARYPGGLSAMRRELRAGNASAMPAPSTRYLAFNLFLSLVAATFGGVIAARLAQPTPNRALLLLAALIVVMSAVSARMPDATLQPRWYKVVIGAIGLAGVALSAGLTRLVAG